MIEYLNVATTVVKKAGELLFRQQAAGIVVNSNTGRDIKLQSDIDSEAIIIHTLFDKTGIPVLSEEKGLVGGTVESDYLWVVDPLDGSLNFSRGIQLNCISVGLWKEKEPLLGVVYNFNNGDLFTAIVGGKAYLNDTEIRVSDVDVLGGAIICTGFPVYSSFDDANLIAFVSKVKKVKKVRLLGSAALSLSFVAKGSAEIYTEERIGFWDVAAGIALVIAAGGKAVYSFCEDNPYLLNVTAYNGAININQL